MTGAESAGRTGIQSSCPVHRAYRAGRVARLGPRVKRGLWRLGLRARVIGMRRTLLVLLLLASSVGAQSDARVLDLEVRDGRVSVLATDQGVVVIAPWRFIKNAPEFDGAAVPVASDVAARWAAEVRSALDSLARAPKSTEVAAHPITAFGAVTFDRREGGTGAVTLAVSSLSAPRWSLELSSSQFSRVVDGVRSAARTTVEMTADRAKRPPPTVRSETEPGSRPPVPKSVILPGDSNMVLIYPPSPRSFLIPPLPSPQSLKGRTVTALLTIDTAGAVRDMHVTSSGDARYDQRMGQMLVHTHFRPARTLDGRAVRTVYTLTIGFGRHP
jgi:hypothetical protein